MQWKISLKYRNVFKSDTLILYYLYYFYQFSCACVFVGVHHSLQFILLFFGFIIYAKTKTLSRRCIHVRCETLSANSSSGLLPCVDRNRWGKDYTGRHFMNKTVKIWNWSIHWSIKNHSFGSFISLALFYLWTFVYVFFCTYCNYHCCCKYFAYPCFLTYC